MNMGIFMAGWNLMANSIALLRGEYEEHPVVEFALGWREATLSSSEGLGGIIYYPSFFTTLVVQIVCGALCIIPFFASIIKLIDYFLFEIPFTEYIDWLFIFEIGFSNLRNASITLYWLFINISSTKMAFS